MNQDLTSALGQLSQSSLTIKLDPATAVELALIFIGSICLIFILIKFFL